MRLLYIGRWLVKSGGLLEFDKSLKCPELRTNVAVKTCFLPLGRNIFFWYLLAVERFMQIMCPIKLHIYIYFMIKKWAKGSDLNYGLLLKHNHSAVKLSQNFFFTFSNLAIYFLCAPASIQLQFYVSNSIKYYLFIHSHLLPSFLLCWFHSVSPLPFTKKGLQVDT